MQKLFLFLAGVSGGVVAGMGMGGGTLLIPILTLFLGVEQHLAQGVNLISFIPMAIITLIIHAKNKLVKFKQIWHLALISGLGAGIGAFFSSKIDSKILAKIFGGFLCLLAFFQLFMLIKNIKNKQKAQNKKKWNNYCKVLVFVVIY